MNGAFNLFTFKVIIDMNVFIAILFIVLDLFLKFFFLPFMSFLSRASSILWKFRSKHKLIAIKNSFVFNTWSFNFKHSYIAGGITKYCKLSGGQWQPQAKLEIYVLCEAAMYPLGIYLIAIICTLKKLYVYDHSLWKIGDSPSIDNWLNKLWSV